MKQYPDWLRKAAAKGGKAKSAAKTAAARKANAARWRGHKPKRVTATPNARADLPRIEDANRESGCEGNNRG